MTPEQIEKWRAAFEAHFVRTRKFPPHRWSWNGRYSDDPIQALWESWQECARLVAADTWERARNVCFAVDETGDYVCHTRDDCANAIDAAAAQEAKS